MTLNEIEQAIRNLITNQPMISSGASGEIINNLLSMINSYRNFKFLIQNHPAQDSFKFNALNISQRTENDLSNAIIQTLQERGINLMMYLSQSQFGMNQTTFNGFQNTNQSQVPPMNMGMNNGVVYNQPMGSPVGQAYPNAGVQYNNPPMGQYPQPGFRPGMGPRPMMQNGRMGGYPRTAAPTQPILFGELEEHTQKPIKPQRKAFSVPKPVAKPTKVAVKKSSKPANEPTVQHHAEPKKLAPEPKVVEPEPEPKVVEKPKPEPAPQVQEDKNNMVKATGRNYLLELLKK